MQDRWMNQEHVTIIQDRNGRLDQSGSSRVHELVVFKIPFILFYFYVLNCEFIEA